MAGIRRQVLEAMVVRLEAIQIANGFQTDAGKAVYFGESPQLGEDDDPEGAIALVPLEGSVRYQAENIVVTLPVEAQALVTADLSNPYVAAEVILEDIVKGMELDDRTFNKLLKWDMKREGYRTLKREPGGKTVGCAVAYSVEFVNGWSET